MDIWMGKWENHWTKMMDFPASYVWLPEEMIQNAVQPLVDFWETSSAIVKGNIANSVATAAPIWPDQSLETRVFC
jgi:hypothetical protein